MALSDAELRATANRIGSLGGGLQHVNELVPLLEALTSASVPLPRRVAVLETVQAVFTQLWHDGHLSSSSSSSSKSDAAAAGKKRKRPEEAQATSAIAKWLRSVFSQFLDVLFFVLATPESSLAKQEARLREKASSSKAPKQQQQQKKKRRGDDDDDDSDAEESAASPEQAAISLRVAALAGLTHFMAHACTTSTQSGQQGQYLCYPQLTAFLGRVLAVDALGVSSSNISSDDSAAAAEAAEAEGGKRNKGGSGFDVSSLSASQHKALSAALTAFIRGYVVEWDDLQYYTCKAIAQMAEEHAASSAAVVAAEDDPDNASKAAVAAITANSTLHSKNAAASSGKGKGKEQIVYTAAQTATFARNAADLLLSLTLPLSQSEWASAEHGSWVRANWDEDIPAVYEAADARVEAAKAAVASKAPKVDRGPNPFSSSSSNNAKGGISDAAMASMGFGDDDGGDSDGDDGGVASSSSSADAGKKQQQGAELPKAVSDVTPNFSLLREQRKALSEAWIALLRLGGALPPDVTRRILLALPTAVLPHMPDRTPLLLADFLVSTVDAGVGNSRNASVDLNGVTTAAAPSDASSSSTTIDAAAGVNAILALQSLFSLMTSHGLEYPRFYAALYALATPATVAAKHRGRFFKQVDLFLSSAALPAYLVAAFMKRFARLALTSPPPVALFVLPLLYNCVKRHPAVTPLLHRAQQQQQSSGSSSSKATGKKGSAAASWPAGGDPFDSVTNDYPHCRALESSLWEVVALSNHYYGPVAHAARQLMRGPPSKAEVDVTDPRISGSTYASLVGEERGRKVTRGGQSVPAEVAWAFEKPHEGARWFCTDGADNEEGAVDFSA